MFKVLTNGCDPTRGTKFSACVDLYASEDVTIGAGETKLVGLGVCVDLNRGFLDDYALSIGKKDDGQDFGEYYKDLENSFMGSHYLQLMLRSSLSKELIIANGVGVVDLDYPGEIKIRLHNPLHAHTYTKVGGGESWDEKVVAYDSCYKIKKGDKIAQITLVEHKSYLFGVESDVERNSGFGSTDKKKD